MDRGAWKLKAAPTNSFNIEDVDGGERSAHKVLLGAGIPIVEHLTRLEELPVDGEVATIGARATRPPTS